MTTPDTALMEQMQDLKRHGLEPLNADQLCYLESVFTEFLRDAIEIVAINPSATPKEYDAYIVFDGTDCKANYGHIYFTCRPIQSIIEDLYVTNVTGAKMIRKDFSSVPCYVPERKGQDAD